ncbi:nuclear receptor subfamily 2 group E member 1 isoform X2 [Ostrinia furnacalis]|uniref:nuclear receptor subfamily 2 group E member 1 isoform X2 n=1 Tax=Ostrinia furnacalis TaxID=93504 RepID=UPI00103B9164|nr:nuclear receptor subfamily 2 group E member 1 isoform X2 [Ostrinia furnacalis]
MDMSILPSSSSNRILYDVPCAVCRDHSSGKHYGVFACDGCAGFFKRSVRRDRQYACKARTPGSCLVDKAHRNQCRACRLAKCLSVGMNRDAVQHERGPRNSTIQRQMAMVFKDHPPRQQGPIDLTTPTRQVLANLPVPHVNNYYSRQAHEFPAWLGPYTRVTSAYLSSPEPNAICESAARIIFMNIKWVKSVPAFLGLKSPSDQLMLVLHSWKELFILGTAQFLYPLAFRCLYNPVHSRCDIRDVDFFEMILDKLARMRPDNNEYACLRGMALFKANMVQMHLPGDEPEIKPLDDLLAVSNLHERSRVVLYEYIAMRYPMAITRAKELIEILELTRAIPARVIEEIFFKNTIRDTALHRIIGDMYSREEPLV